MKKTILLISIGMFSLAGYAQQDTAEKKQTPVAADKLHQVDPKDFNESEQINRLLVAFDRISANEHKLRTIAERTAEIPPEEIENSEIQQLIEKYQHEKEMAEKKVVSIEHFLKSKDVKVEIPRERYERYSESVQQRISKEKMYLITSSN